jgi:glycerol kinase
MAQRAFPQIFPKPGWVEHDPAQLWSSQLEAAREVLTLASAKSEDVAAIGIANQRETTVVWDAASGLPVYNAIVWQDRRTAAHCGQLRLEGKETLFRDKTGLLLDPYFSGTKARWILDHIPGARDKAERGKLLFGTVDTWLAWQLTGGRAHVADPSNASRTLMYNIKTGQWDEELLRCLDVPASMLPQVIDSSGVFGNCLAACFGGEIALAGLAGDQQAAAFGQGCLQPGMGKNTYGTGCFMLMNTGAQAASSENNLLATVAWKIGTRTDYALEGSVFMAGASVQWLRDGLGIISQASDVEALARSVPDNGGVYLVPAFTGLGAPHWDPYARGTILGLSRGAGKGHLARATLESIAYQSADLLEAMRDDSGISPRELRVDGGAARNDLLMQFQADIIDLPVIRPQVTETTALGAACLAGLAVGFWNSLEAISSQWQAERCFAPAMSEDQRRALLADWRRAVDRAKAWAAPDGTA